MFNMFTLAIVFLSLVGLVSSFSLAGKITRTQLSMVSVGEAAPDFDLKNSVGKSFKLSSFKGKQPVVIFFYPADSTPGCTKEACAFEKKAPDFKGLKAQVFGISSGNAADKDKFIRTNKLNSMELLIDSEDKARNAFKVPR